jgi:hypothetical protein
MLANIYRQEVVNIRTHDLIIIDVLNNKINESLEHENNLPANHNTRLSETKYLENKTNILIYLLLFILLLITWFISESRISVSRAFLPSFLPYYFNTRFLS